MTSGSIMTSLAIFLRGMFGFHQLNMMLFEAVETIKLAAKQHGLDISGGTIRRTSSRFCLGVEHGDYNGTELFGVGTDRFIWMGYKPNDSGKIRIFSQNFPEKVVEFKAGEVPPPKSSSISDTWARFPYGVEHVLRTNGFDTSRGFDAVMLASNLTCFYMFLQRCVSTD